MRRGTIGGVGFLTLKKNVKAARHSVHDQLPSEDMRQRFSLRESPGSLCLVIVYEVTFACSDFDDEGLSDLHYALFRDLNAIEGVEVAHLSSRPVLGMGPRERQKRSTTAGSDGATRASLPR